MILFIVKVMIFKIFAELGRHQEGQITLTMDSSLVDVTTGKFVEITLNLGKFGEFYVYFFFLFVEL